MSDILKTRARLEELWFERCAGHSSLIGRFTDHGLVEASTAELGAKPKLTVNQYVTAALVEAYEQGRLDARDEAQAIAKATRQGTLQMLTRRLRGYADDLERECAKL